MGVEVSSFLYLHIAWRGEVLKDFPSFRKVDIIPTNEHPLGRKGYTLTQCWKTMKESHTKGMLILDGDVAIDPVDFALMYNAMRADNDAIHIGPSRIWPKSTGHPDWIWAHRKFGTTYKDWKEFRTDVDTASFCFTYIPARVINACISSGMEKWIYPEVDKSVFEIARKLEIRYNVVEGCYPKHMNF